jgi:uncharacterized SAM-binding protein YcdF (DUF218 family)
MLRKLVEHLVLPPTALFVLALAGVLLWRRRPRLARGLVGGAAGIFFLLCQPYFAAALLRSLQGHAALVDPSAGGVGGAGAIVVLTADHQPSAAEYGGATVGPVTLERLRYAARLAHETGLPVLVAGGRPRSGIAPLATLAREALERDFRTPVRWTEERSANTRQNVAFAAELLRAEGIDTVLLVTHAWHMPRALAECGRSGLRALPAPTCFRAWPACELASFWPSVRAMRESTWALHEWLGRAWYAITA